MAKKASSKKSEAQTPAVKEMIEQPLWKLNAEMIALIEKIEAAAEENEGVIPEALDNEWSSLGEAIEQKVDNCGIALKAFDFNIGRIKDEEDRIKAVYLEPLRDLRKAHEEAKGRLKDYVIRQFEIAEEKRVDGSFTRLRVQATDGSTEVVNSNIVPDEFKDVTLIMTRAEYIALRNMIRAHRSEKECERLKSYVVDEVVKKKRAKEAAGRPEWVKGIPGIEFVPGKALVQF